MEMDKLLKQGEVIDTLHLKDYRIIQKQSGFKFGIDAVLLSYFSQVNEGERHLDLGTGTGVIPILLQAQTAGEHFTGLEIQSDFAEMASRSVRLNQIQDQVDMVQGDIRQASQIFGKSSFEVVTSNPPYVGVGKGMVNVDSPKYIAKHEVLCNLDQLSMAASELLKPRGRFYLVHRPTRLGEIIRSLSKYQLEPKRLRCVQAYRDSNANLVLIEAVKGGRPEVTVESALVVYEQKQVYTEQMKRIYGIQNVPES